MVYITFQVNGRREGCERLFFENDFGSDSWHVRISMWKKNLLLHCVEILLALQVRVNPGYLHTEQVDRTIG